MNATPNASKIGPNWMLYELSDETPPGLSASSLQQLALKAALFPNHQPAQNWMEDELTVGHPSGGSSSSVDGYAQSFFKNLQ